MPLGTMDLKTFLQSSSAESMTEQHLITFLYNLLCSINYLHSMNIIHRDIKPANILIDEKCGVFICDFGLSRASPPMSEIEQNIETKRKEGQHKINKLKGEERLSRQKKFRKETSLLLKEKKTELAKQPRSLTCGVMSRFYRGPEVITLHK